ncbi:DUF4194 domain-containing protein [Eisenbergiella porci]|uniref:DUF4194 domain-containing protein n=1 Tax=Eisenbergiella porci TaxID=2652274 RepID=UPI002A7F37C0|nr:DUF4194 domain-containing protein [Eisenbergiella porci]
MLEIYEQLTQEEQEKLQDVIRQLYRQTFLLERKYDKKAGRMIANKDFYFCDKHMEFLMAYFAVAGVRLNQNTELGTIWLQGEATMGERLPKLATIYLLLLKLIYDEQMAAVSSSVNIVTTFGELNGKVGEFRLAKSLSSLTEIKRALALLKKYQMIELIDVLEELNEHTRIIIYPCINLVLMREDILKLLNSFSEEEAVPDANEEEEGEMPDGDTADTDNAAGEFTDPDAGYTDSGDADAGYTDTGYTDAGYTDAGYTDTAAD